MHDGDTETVVNTCSCNCLLLLNMACVDCEVYGGDDRGMSNSLQCLLLQKEYCEKVVCSVVLQSFIGCWKNDKRCGNGSL